MSKRDVLAIVGSRNFDRHMAIVEARDIIEGVLKRQRPDEIVSGGARGIDYLAKVIAGEYGIPFRECLPRNQRWEPDGFKARNIEIASACTRLLCIRSRSATSYGSGWTADYAEQKLGVLVWRVLL